MTELRLGNINFAPLNRALIGFDQLFDTLEYRTAANYPPYNVIKTDENNYAIEVAVAGFKKQEITVQVDKDQLVVKGAKQKDEEKQQYLHHGLSARSFTHRFTIAEHMVVKSAVMEDGILKVVLERKLPESKKPLIIEIN
jgi:molecular chaperone IbpA